LRRSHDRGIGKGAIDLVSAWACANHLVLGQVKVDEKSNEITAIPQLLKALEISGCIITIDAMGCQTEIAQTIIEEGADYVLALKDNQGNLFEDTQKLFEDLERSQYQAYTISYKLRV
jgi:predicted transposase YbfD/YdcC